MDEIVTELPWTGERYVPQLSGTIALEHLHRYAVASEFVKGKRVLDLASGEGYGSEMLSRTAASVIGVDIDPGSIAHAQRKYQKSNLTFKVGSCTEIPLHDHSVDIVISFETIEHIADHEQMLSEIKRVLAPDGILIISSPEKHEYTEVPDHHNQFHVKELNANEFKELLEKYFQHFKILGQRVIYGSGIFEAGSASSFGGVYDFSKLPGEVTKKEGVPKALYLIAVCSDKKLSNIESSFCEQPLWESDSWKEWAVNLGEKDNQLFLKDAQLDEKNLLIGQKDIQLQQVINQLDEKKLQIEQKDIQIAAKEEQLLSKDSYIAEQKNKLDQNVLQITEQQSKISEQEGELLKKNDKIAEQQKVFATQQSQVAIINKNKIIQKVLGPSNIIIRRAIRTRMMTFEIARSGLFDKAWYLRQNPDVASSGMHPIIHYINFGEKEGRNPNPLFNVKWYVDQYSDVKKAAISPFHHYIKHGKKEGRSASANKSNNLLQLRQEIEFSKKRECRDSRNYLDDIRAIAIYLPQYHKIKENNKWWGEGFTEWTNTKRGTPFYQAHYQPHIPHPDIGYYDLDDELVLEKQAQLASEHGIYGFCYYYYWFNGKRLLEKPLDHLLKTGKPDFPFCFCWANENWTRTWDGGDKKILIEQNHSYESDELFIRDLIPALKDPRYIQINNKPLVIIYRPTLLPDMAATASHWREVCRKEGVGEIYLAGMRSFEFIDPVQYGLDAAIQFPPANVPATDFSSTAELKVKKGFAGRIHDMKEMISFYSQEEASFPLIRSVCPSWDNTARRMERGTSWINSNPSNYYYWLSEVVKKTKEKFKEGERFLFINAWNEWGEGCHLEPDEKYGYSWLNATRKALLDRGKQEEEPYILVISHDAAMAGAQILTLSLLKEWARSKAINFKIICGKGGELRKAFKALGATLFLDDCLNEGEKASALSDFVSKNVIGIYSSTVVNGLLLKKLRYLNVPIITHAHELQQAIESWAPGEIIKATVTNSDLILGGSLKVIENLQHNHFLPLEKVGVALDFIQSWSSDEEPAKEEKAVLAIELGIKDNDIIVFGCGTTDWRKGPDLFLETAFEACAKNNNLKFIWIGGDPVLYNAAVKKRELEKRIIFLSNRSVSRRYYYLGDIFFLSSREDPSPLVALEAADAGLPIVCFAEAGDIPDFVKTDAGMTVPLENTHAAAEAIISLAEDKKLRVSLGLTAKKRVKDTHNVVKIAADILEVFKKQQAVFSAKQHNRALVSVIVPSYNHAHYLEERLQSIVSQTHKDLEIIILDDASSDNSQTIIKQFLKKEPRAHAFFNDVNSGSPFKQWRKGIEMASGKYIWIAESDDCANSKLIEELLSQLERDASISIATCQLIMMHKNGSLGGRPNEWVEDFNSDRWDSDYINNGIDEIRRFLSKKNTILNASGVIIRNFQGLASLVDDNMRLCADWLLWVRLLERGNIAYVANPLNYWRMNSGNARNAEKGVLELQEGPVIIREAGRILKWGQKEIESAQETLKLFYESSSK